MFTEDDEYSENEDAPPLTSPPPPPPPPPPQKTYAAFNYPPPPAVEPPASRPSVKPVPTGDEAHPGASRSLGAARRCVEHFMGDGDAELEAALAARPTRRGRGGRALDETTLQQLRAIFAANDADGAEALDEAQLKGAIEMLGLKASTALVSKFFARREDDLSETISLPEFVLAAADELDAAQSIEPEMLQLFQLFDEPGTGAVDVATLRHLLCDFTSPERLTKEEFDDFAECAGLSGGEDVKFDYKKYVHNMMVGKPLVSMRV